MVELRGNVDTRLRKLAEGDCDALVLAVAGLERLGREQDADGVLDELLPAAGQGALALEARAGGIDPAALERLRDPDATACVLAERELTRVLGPPATRRSGRTPRRVDAERIELRAWVGLPDGSAWVADRLIGQPAWIGEAVAERMLAAGAGELLRAASRTASSAGALAG